MLGEWRFYRRDLGELPEPFHCVETQHGLVSSGSEPSPDRDLVTAAEIAGKMRQCKARGTNIF